MASKTPFEKLKADALALGKRPIKVNRLNRPNKLIYDTSVDAGVRLLELLKTDKLDAFRKAAATAGAQLELLKSNPAVSLPGTAVVVLADKERVFTAYLSRSPGGSLGDVVEEAVAQFCAELRNNGGKSIQPIVTAVMGMNDDDWRDNLSFIIKKTLETYGSAPGQQDPKHSSIIPGMLFMTMSEETRTLLAEFLDYACVNDICPATVGLLSGISWTWVPILAMPYVIKE